MDMRAEVWEMVVEEEAARSGRLVELALSGSGVMAEWARVAARRGALGEALGVELGLKQKMTGVEA